EGDEPRPAFYQLVTRQALTYGIAQPDQQWSGRDNPQCGRREPKAPHMERGHCNTHLDRNLLGATADATLDLPQTTIIASRNHGRLARIVPDDTKCSRDQRMQCQA